MAIYKKKQLTPKNLLASLKGTIQKIRGKDSVNIKDKNKSNVTDNLNVKNNTNKSESITIKMTPRMNRKMDHLQEKYTQSIGGKKTVLIMKEGCNIKSNIINVDSIELMEQSTKSIKGILKNNNTINSSPKKKVRFADLLYKETILLCKLGSYKIKKDYLTQQIKNCEQQIKNCQETIKLTSKKEKKQLQQYEQELQQYKQELEESKQNIEAIKIQATNLEIDPNIDQYKEILPEGQKKLQDYGDWLNSKKTALLEELKHYENELKIVNALKKTMVKNSNTTQSVPSTLSHNIKTSKLKSCERKQECRQKRQEKILIH